MVSLNQVANLERGDKMLAYAKKNSMLEIFDVFKYRKQWGTH